MHLDKASYDIEIQFSLWPFWRQTFGRRVDKKIETMQVEAG